MTKKEEILLNVAKIIHEEGIQKLTINRVADKSNLTKGGVLYHFDSKEKLILQMNEMIIGQFEETISRHQSTLSGPYLFTRAYAKATIEMLQDEDNILLPAVFISALDNKKSEQRWIQASDKWSTQFQSDEGELSNIIELRMICDGAWFSVMYQYGEKFRSDLIDVITNYCERLEREEV